MPEDEIMYSTGVGIKLGELKDEGSQSTYTKQGSPYIEICTCEKMKTKQTGEPGKHSKRSAKPPVKSN